MSGLVIDYKNIINPDFKFLLERISPPPKTKNNVGLVLIINKKQLAFLQNIPFGNDRVKYINNKDFVNSISSYYYTIYDKEKNICELRELIDKNDLEIILLALMNDLPPSTILWTGIFDINKNIDFYIDNGFNNPYICKESPLGHKYSTNGLAFYKKNTIEITDISSVKNEVKYVKKEYKSPICGIFARLSKHSIESLKLLTQPTPTINKDGTMTQKEMSGIIKIGSITNENGKIIFEMVDEPSSVVAGIEEEVDAVLNRYNFHTHPKQAYIRNGVTNGWPSSQDYVGFIDLDGYTIFHIVVTMEGLYILSFSEYWQDKHDKIDKKFVYKHFDIDHLEDMKIPDYVKNINNIKYKDKPLFHISFMTWDKATDIFPAFYSKSGDNCLATEEGINMYEKYY